MDQHQTEVAGGALVPTMVNIAIKANPKETVNAKKLRQQVYAAFEEDEDGCGVMNSMLTHHDLPSNGRSTKVWPSWFLSLLTAIDEKQHVRNSPITVFEECTYIAMFLSDFGDRGGDAPCDNDDDDGCCAVRCLFGPGATVEDEGEHVELHIPAFGLTVRVDREGQCWSVFPTPS